MWIIDQHSAVGFVSLSGPGEIAVSAQICCVNSLRTELAITTPAVGARMTNRC
jgi:hypothetical protein